VATADDRFVQRWLPWARFAAGCCRARIEGLERLPTERPFLLVANHSGVFGLAELVCLAALWFGRFGVSRPLAAVAHHLGFRLPGLRHLHRLLGSVPSIAPAMRAALASGVPLLIFPGGDHEAFRPIWQANRVDFGGRTGFARLALEAGVPIYPLAIVGSAWTAPVVWRSTWLLPRLWLLPHLAGVKRWPLTLAGLLGAIALVAWLPGPWSALAAVFWLASPLSMAPWLPVRLRFVVGEAVHTGDDPVVTARDVEATLQRMVDQHRQN
jgi:1-acyl-sn-glycerol-3-phosphate acyltransferase